MNNFDSLKRGTIELLLLKIISEGDCYGYQISQLIKYLSGGVLTVPEGSMYPTLYKLQEKNYISDYRKKVGKRLERVYYHIEPEGEKRLRELIRDYREVCKATENILDYTSKGDFAEVIERGIKNCEA